MATEFLFVEKDGSFVETINIDVFVLTYGRIVKVDAVHWRFWCSQQMNDERQCQYVYPLNVVGNPPRGNINV